MAAERITRRKFIRQATTLTAGAALGATALGGGIAVAVGKRPPNILLLYSDQHNARALGCAGHPDVKTPHLDELAARGVRFERSYCQNAVCCPSRTTLLTGLYARSHGVIFNGKYERLPDLQGLPLPLHLKSHGYRTGAFGKRHLGKVLDRGWDVTGSTLRPELEHSDDNYWDWIRQTSQWNAFQSDWDAEFGGRYKPSRAATMASRISQLTPEATMEAWTARKSIEFIRAAANGDQPFFCWSSFYRPHQPYTPLQSYFNLYDPRKLQLPGSLNEPPEHLPLVLRHRRLSTTPCWDLARGAKDPDLYRFFLACYYGCLTEIDHHIGAILDVLRETGQADNTIIVYTTDHGDFAGHHGLVEKAADGHNVYEETLRVPLIVSYPRGGVCSSDVCHDLVQTTDLYPTLLDLAGLERPARYDLPGCSLAPALTGRKPVGRQVAFSENMVQITAIGGRYKLGVWIKRFEPDYPDMLFDREQDPLELNNLIGQPKIAEVEKKLRHEIAAWMARTPNVTGLPLQPSA
jgi:arylsulfatase A-like enzyme